MIEYFIVFLSLFDFVAMPIVFVDPPPTAEQMDSLASFFDGMKDAPSIPEKGSIGVVLAAITKGLDLIFTKSETGEVISIL